MFCSIISDAHVDCLVAATIDRCPVNDDNQPIAAPMGTGKPKVCPVFFKVEVPNVQLPFPVLPSIGEWANVRGYPRHGAGVDPA